ncbi:MAG: hypothetical protein JNJ58_08580 [Chitinophagaceae bacterium]|nr:hypothetical protein [Chitinophagaceae bacterium]
MGKFNTNGFGMDGFSLNSVGSYDLFIAKWDTLGNTLWMKTISGVGIETADELHIDQSGHLILGGKSTSATLQMDTVLSVALPGAHAFLGKMDTAGNGLWLKRYGSSTLDSIGSICTDDQLNIYTSAKIDFQRGIHVFDSNGVWSWVKSFNNIPKRLRYSAIDSSIVGLGLFSSGSATATAYLNIDTFSTSSCSSTAYGIGVGNYIYKMAINGDSKWLNRLYTDCKFSWILNATIRQSDGVIIFTGGPNILPSLCCLLDGQLQLMSPNGQLLADTIDRFFGQDAYFIGSPISIENNLLVHYRHVWISVVDMDSLKQVKNYFLNGPNLLLGTGVDPEIHPVILDGNIYAGGTLSDSLGNFLALGRIGLSTAFVQPHSDTTVHTCLGTPISISGSSYGGMAPYTYSWSPTTGLTSSNTYATTYSGNGNSTFILTITDSIGQSVNDTVHVITSPPEITPIITASDTVLCNGNDTITLSSNITGGFWFLGTSIIGTDQTVNINTAGTYGYLKNSACSTFTYNIGIHNVLPPPTLNVSPTNYICQGEMVQLNASGALFYTWSGGVQNGVPFTCPLTNTIYTVVASDANGCTNSKMVSIIVKPAPIITAHTTDSIVCPGTGTILYGEGGSYYIWSGSVLNNKVFFPTHSATYYVSGSGTNGCNGKDSIFIQVDSLPMVIARATDSVICFGESIQLIGDGALTYIWSGGIEDKEIIIPEVTSTYYVTGTDANGCVSHSSIKIYVNPLPEASIGFAPPNHLMTSSSGTYQWYFNNQPVPLTGPNYTDYIGNGIYQVLVTDSNGCESLSQPYLAHITEDWYVTPNPFTDELLLTLHIPENEIISCTLFDGLGNIIKKTPDQFDVLKGMHVYHFTHLENLPHGVYFLQVILSEERRVFKVVK